LSTYNFRPRVSGQKSRLGVLQREVTVQNFNVRSAHKQLLFLCDLDSATRANLRAVEVGGCCIDLLRYSMPRYSTSMQSFCLMSVYLSVAFGIRQYILVFSLISSNFISVLFIVDCRFGIRVHPLPVKKICHIFITFEVYILKMQYGMHLSLDVRLFKVIA